MEQPNKLSTGQILKTRRLEKELSLETVSQETRITVKFIKALEENNYSAFDSFVFASGFIKIYGKFLGLNTEKLLALYRREYFTNTKNQSNTQKHSSIKPKRFNFKSYLTPDNLIKAIATLFVITIVGYVYADFYKYKETPKIDIISPENNYISKESTVKIKGLTNINSDVYINDNKIPVNPDYTFEYVITLTPGINEIQIRAINKINHNKENSVKLVVNYDVDNKPKEIEQNQPKEISKKITLITTEANVWIQLVIDDKQELAQILSTSIEQEYIFNKYFQIITGRPTATKIIYNEKEIPLKVNPDTGTVNMSCRLKNSELQCE